MWVSPSSALTGADIARAESRTAADGQRTVSVVFTAEGARKMAQLSTAPIVRATIDNEAVISGVTPDVLERVLVAIKR